MKSLTPSSRALFALICLSAFVLSHSLHAQTLSATSLGNIDAGSQIDGGNKKGKPKPPDGESDWKNTGGTDWNTGANWTGVAGGSAPPAAVDIAWFKTAFASGQPNLSASTSIAGIYFNGTGSSGYDITSSTTAIKFTLTGTSTSSGAIAETSVASANAIRGDNTSGTNTIDAPIVLGATVSQAFVQAAGGTLVLNGVISSPNVITLSLGTLAGNFQFNGANTFAGGLTFGNTGSLSLGNDSALGTGTFLVSAAGTISAGAGGHTLSNAVTWGANATIGGANDLNFSGNFTSSGSNTRTLTVTNAGTTTLSGNVFLSETQATARNLSILGTGNVVISGVIADSSTGTTNGTLANNGLTVNQTAGSLTLSNANTYTGSTTLSQGTLILGNKAAFGTSTVKWNGVSTSASTDLSGANAIANTSTLGASGNVFTGTNNIELSGTVSNLAGLPNSTNTVTNNMSAGTLTLSNTLNLSSGANSRTVNFNGTGNTTISGVVANGSTVASNLSYSGAGTLTMSGASTYTGTTVVNSGTLKVDSAGSTTARLAGTTGITVNSGGTLLMANSTGTTSNDRINDAATMALNGGTFNTGGLSEHGVTNNTAGIGALTLQSSSIIDMGTGSSIIAFANSSAQTWTGTLSIYNWSGTPLTGNGTDQVYFGNDNTGLNAGQLSNIVFYSDNGVTGLGVAAMLADGEIVPVPEPATWVTGALAVMGLAYFQRKRISLLLKRG